MVDPHALCWGTIGRVCGETMPVSGKVTVALCALGVVGSLFIGYCIYFDRKRRSDPDYKKKIRERKY